MSNNVFGLDIGTRNVVGTVGYKNDEGDFVVVAQHNIQHESRAMLDGQIHDIGRVGATIEKVKKELEEQCGEELTEVCIAAAGRVLKTIHTHIEYDYPEESVVTEEDIHTLDLLGVEKAQQILKDNNDTNYKFYCVGYSVEKYYLNEEVFINLESHKATKIGEDIIATFLPEDVVDGLYSAVGKANMTVANMTLEPIAAINVAIPENFRLLNIALVDVGAGTSDISITRDGSIIAYGMIPHAGDELTEVIVQHFLVDFKTAETMKLASTVDEEVTYQDIMSIPHTIPSTEIWDLVQPVVDRITAEVAEEIKKLNGDKSVSACFVVGGGGKVHGFTEALAKHLDLANERVALRGEEVLGDIIFEQEDIKKDPLIVTPIGICLNYYDQKNNFILVHFNGERIKLYDNNHLTVVDAALTAGFPNDALFPKRGTPINFTVNGAQRIARGEAGDSAVVTLNGKPANINTPLEPNCEITITPSSSGSDAIYTVGQLEELRNNTMSFVVNGKRVNCPKFVEVNGVLEPESYNIKEGDVIETRSFYTVGQVAEFLDVVIDDSHQILVNNKVANLDTLVYENFSLDCAFDNNPVFEGENIPKFSDAEAVDSEEDDEEEEGYGTYTPSDEPVSEEKQRAFDKRMDDLEKKRNEKKAREQEEEAKKAKEEEKPAGIDIVVYVNNTPVTLQGKTEYIFVDIFDFYDFDLKAGGGRAVVTNLNGREAGFTEKLAPGDKIDIYWKEN